MYFLLARAASRMVWPAVASMYSPSILIEILSGMLEMSLLGGWEGGQFCPGVPLRGTAFSRLWPPRKASPEGTPAKIGRPPERLAHGGVGGHDGSLSLDQIRNAMAVLVLTDVATQAAAGFVQGLLRGEAQHGFVEVQHALAGGQFSQLMARAFAGLPGRRFGIFEPGHDAVETGGAHEAPVDVARGLLAQAHGVRNIRSAGDGVAAGIEFVAAGFEREAVDLDGAGLLDLQAGAAAEIGVNGLAHGQNHGVAFIAADFFGGDGLAAPGGIEFAQAGFDDLNRLDVRLIVAHDAVRSGEENELGAFRFGGIGLLFDGGHVDRESVV